MYNNDILKKKSLNNDNKTRPSKFPLTSPPSSPSVVKAPLPNKKPRIKPSKTTLATDTMIIFFLSPSPKL